jgi:lipopolysaccharide/colanic/teichoic acid biosynthesis glycosyltransferase
MSLAVNPVLPVAMHQGSVSEKNEVRSLYFTVKRMFDTTAALVLLIMFSPIMMLVALVIMLDGGGPILFRQPRIGYGCRRFMMLKFRTMRNDGFVPSVPIKSDRDPRITRVGRFLRKMSLDELPQLWNVLRGDMSLVGPRPELVEMLRFYRPEHYLRHRAIPGLTGWWQVNGRCRRRLGCSPDEDLQMKLVDDLEYLERRSFLFDLHLLVKTIPVVITGRGAA